MIKRFILALIRAYRVGSCYFSPHCRFYPTCSAYTYEAIETYGILRGGAMGLKRVARCHPYSPGGADPVPLLSHSPTQ